MRLATFVPPGTDGPLGGAVDGDRVTAFGDGSTVVERLATGDVVRIEIEGLGAIEHAIA